MYEKNNTNPISKKILFLTQASMIAALYIVLTFIFQPIGFMEVQVRIAEALTILPFFTPAAIPGLFVGCLLGNILGNAIWLDIVFGSLATLIGAIFSYLLRKHKFLVCIPPIICNLIIVPFILKYGYQSPFPIPIIMLTVGIGEIISCALLGNILLISLTKYKNIIFKKNIA